MSEGFNVAWSSTYGTHNIYKPIKTVNTGNKVADYILGTLAGSLNILGAGLNVISNGIGASLELQEIGIDFLDQNIPSYLTASGSFKQDLDALTFIGLTNPQLTTQLASNFTNSKIQKSATNYSGKQSNHGNSLSTTKPAQGYALRNRDTKNVLKYGETTQGNKRYTQKYLRDNNAYMDFAADGTKLEMHNWQHEKILEYKANNNGQRPPLNKSDW